jgi:Mce-associated membrane protein
MSRPTPRKPASSRGQTPRPRRIAGQAGAARPAADDANDVTDAVDAPASPRPTTKATPATTPDPAGPGTSGPGVLARPRTTRILIAVLALVTIALVAEFVLLAVDRLGDDDEASARDNAGAGSLVVPKGRPVVASALQWRDGVEAAAKAAQELVSVDYSKYDDEVKKAVALTTERYEKDYLKTIGDVKEQGIAQQLKVQASVVAQGVVRANRTRLEALVFLNQVVERVREGKKETVVTPYRVLVTMVHTDHGWLVDRLDTDDPSAAARQDAPSGAPSSDVPSQDAPTQDAPTQDKTN